MNTILTDDERLNLPEPEYGPDVCVDPHSDGAYTVEQMEAYADAREAAVLAKLARQADRQRVPDGWVQPRMPAKMSGPITPTQEAYGFVNGWNACIDAMLAAAPEAPARADECSATGRGHTFGAHGPNGERQCEYCGEAPAQGETVTLQEVWEWAGGNPGIKPTRDEVRQALKMLDKVCDEAPAQASAADERDRKDAERYRWLRKQHWTENLIGVVIRPKDNARLGSMLPSLEILDDTIDHMQARAALAQKGGAA